MKFDKEFLLPFIILDFGYFSMPYSVYLPTFQGVWYVLLHKFREQKDFEGGTV
jgi:hypothetical protein